MRFEESQELWERVSALLFFGPTVSGVVASLWIYLKCHLLAVWQCSICDKFFRTVEVTGYIPFAIVFKNAVRFNISIVPEYIDFITDLLNLSKKFPRQEIRWNFRISRNAKAESLKLIRFPINSKILIKIQTASTQGFF